MNDWEKDPESRRQATIEFCKHLHDPKNAADRAKCKANSDDAKRLFASLGHFYVEGDKRAPGDEALTAIPKATNFVVYEADEIPPRDALVTLVLPSEHKPLPAELDPDAVYRCTWIAWESFIGTSQAQK